MVNSEPNDNWTDHTGRWLFYGTEALSQKFGFQAADQPTVSREVTEG